MALTAGHRIGQYEIVSALGAGGMGEVYRATDTKLRQVALKVLPESFTHDPDRVARFQREARTLASLNHPNIGGIHGLEEAAGVTALVLELVEGPTLAGMLAPGSGPQAPGASGSRPGDGRSLESEARSLPIDEALEIAKQIAEALGVVHEHGIIHRDLTRRSMRPLS